MDRRAFNTALLSAAATSVIGSEHGWRPQGAPCSIKASGTRLTQWDVDVDAATLTPRASVTLPSNIQYVWPHPSRKYLYVSTSDAASGNAPNPGKVHRLCVLRVERAARLDARRTEVLPQRPIHNSVDPAAITHSLATTIRATSPYIASTATERSVRKFNKKPSWITVFSRIILVHARQSLRDYGHAGNRPEATRPKIPAR